MGLISWIKEKLGFGEDDFDDIEIGMSSDNAESLMESLANVSRKRRTINMHEKAQRDQYIREYCDMMALTSKDVEAQKVEYHQVTERLSDLEELDKLPLVDKSQVRIKAKKVIQIEEEDAGYSRPSQKITENQYREMERLRNEIPNVISKMQEDEAYQMTVRRDLNLLEGEKSAIAYMRKEERAKAKNARTFAVVSVFAAIMALLLLFVVNKTMYIRVQMGYMAVVALFAICLTAVCVMYQNAQAGIARSNRKLNKTISLQNTVKIKYVNITNVLDYNYAKYRVNNSYELSYLWEKYNEERSARQRDTELTMRLEDARSQLYQLLKHYHIADPSVWVYQPGILVYEEEAKEIRTALIVQRQRLKKGIDFEMYNLEAAKKEIQSLVKEYPKYAQDIIAIVEEYE